MVRNIKAVFLGLRKASIKFPSKEHLANADTNLVCDIPGGKKTLLIFSLVVLYGSLKINSEPSGAEVYVDEKFMGNTPLFLDKILAIHNRRLTIKCAGHKK